MTKSLKAFAIWLLLAVAMGGAVAPEAIAQSTIGVNIKNFGAKGDDATDDSAAIQKALDSGAKKLYAPAGTYRGTLHNVPSNIEIYGDGDATVFKLNGNSDVFKISGRSNVTLRDFKIDGLRATHSSTSNDAIDIDCTSTACSNVKIRNVTIRDIGGTGVQALAAVGTPSTDLYVENVDVENAGAHAIISQDYWSNVWFRGNRVKSWGLGVANRVGITGSRSGSNVVISDNIVIGSASALGTSVHGISVDRTSNATVKGNIVKDTIGFGIEAGIVTNGSITGNTVTGGTRAGIALSGTQSPAERNVNVSVTGNNLSGGAKQGVYAFITGATGTVVHENITISGNSINGYTNGTEGFGMQLEFVDKLSVSGNSVYNSGLAGIYVVDCVNHFIDGNVVVHNNIGALKSVSSLTLSGSTATVTSASHGYSNGDTITIFGANPAEYNGSFVIANVATDTFDYTTSSGLTTPAVGTIKATKPTNTAYAGIRVSYPTVSTKNQWALGRNYVFGNGFREVYDVSVNSPVGLMNDYIVLKETKQPRAENLTSGESANVLDRAAVFVKNNKFVIAYNNAGTITYITIDLDGSDTTWAHGTTAP